MPAIKENDFLHPRQSHEEESVGEKYTFVQERRVHIRFSESNLRPFDLSFSNKYKFGSISLLLTGMKIATINKIYQSFQTYRKAIFVGEIAKLGNL